MARKQSNIHYIYKTTCLVTGRYYIGMHSTSKLEDGYMGSGKRLRYSMRKHGVENHVKEILEFLDTRELLIEREKQIVTLELIKDDLCMNLRDGGTGGFSVAQQIQNAINSNAKQKILRETNPEWVDKTGKNRSAGAKKAYKEGRLIRKYFCDWNGKKHTIETKQLLSDLKKNTGTGNTNSQYGTCWITRDNENKKIKKEDLEKYLNEGWSKGRVQ